MRITALKRDTGLSQTYYLDTYSTVTGVIVSVYDSKRTLIGQFTNNRQDTNDKRPLEGVIQYDPKMDEVVQHWSK